MIGVSIWRLGVKKAIKNYRVGERIPHTGENDLPGLCLVEDVLTDLTRPDWMTPVIRGFFIDADCIPGAECRTAVTGNAIAGVYSDCIPIVPEDPI